MKKIIAFLLCLSLLLSFAACGGKAEDKKPSSSEPTASIPVLGTEIGSEEATDKTEPESSEESSSEEEPFDPDGVYETGKEPFMGEEQTASYTEKVDFESDGAYVLSSGFEKYTADKAGIHGGNVSLVTRADSWEDPSFYFSVPNMERDAECEITLFVLLKTAVNKNIEFSTVSADAADATVPLTGIVPDKWSSVTASFFASSADVYVKVPMGVELYIDDITLTYKQ